MGLTYLLASHSNDADLWRNFVLPKRILEDATKRENRIGASVMHRKLLAIISALTLLVTLNATGMRVAATWSGSVTDVLDSSYQTQGCHDNPYYFNPIYGWTRSCSGAHDIGNGYANANIYIRGYVWTSAQIVNAQGNNVYYDTGCSSLAGVEYNNAWQIAVSAGTIGTAFHHMSNYHYSVNSTVGNGTHVGEQANWGAYVYYCSGSLASQGPHVHTEAAEVGTSFSDTWAFGTSSPNYPYISYTQP